MPPELDLSQSTHAKIMAAPSRLNLRRAASYHNYERANGPASSTSSRFNFNHLLFSPPPSPSLPALLPRRKRSPSQILLASRPSRILRTFFYIVGLVAAFYLLFTVRDRGAIPTLWPDFGTGEFEMVGQNALPDFPTPIVAGDAQGRSKWTVSVPRNYDFPLSTQEYTDMKSQCREVSSRVRDIHGKPPLTEEASLLENAPDGYFVDVEEAERTGLLPGASKGAPPRDTGHFVGLGGGRMIGKPVCQRSMTFVLESPDAGLGGALMTMWTLFALAKEQGTAFFIDDSRWAWGAYMDIFQAPPIPDCRPPPRHQMLPCPVQARHLVVSSVTAHDVLPALMAKHHRLSSTTNNRRDQLELARSGYHSLFGLDKEDEKYVEARIRQLRTKAKGVDTTATAAPVIGLHIRHGDQHPIEYQYRDTYIPNEVFLSRTQNIVDAYYNETTTEPDARSAITILASDDPTVHTEPEFSEAFLAQERIRLASKQAIHDANPDPHVLHRFVDETFGWEGGFFAAMFWNLGGERKNNAANAPIGVKAQDGSGESDKMAPPTEETLRLRSLIGRAYMMDLAVLAGASDKVVCAVSATGCRLLGVMMGWEEGIENGRWVNVDGDYGWSGIDW